MSKHHHKHHLVPLECNTALKETLLGGIPILFPQSYPNHWLPQGEGEKNSSQAWPEQGAGRQIADEAADLALSTKIRPSLHWEVAAHASSALQVRWEKSQT